MLINEKKIIKWEIGTGDDPGSGGVTEMVSEP
jgi:hypothetical protein